MAKPGPKGKHKADQIDLVQLEKLAAMQCTVGEIAAFFNICNDTIERNTVFMEIIRRHREKGKITLKRVLFEKMQKGDLGAIIWWGKQFAGMSDKVEQKADVNQTTTVVYDTTYGGKTLEELEKKIETK